VDRCSAGGAVVVAVVVVVDVVVAVHADDPRPGSV